MDEPKEKTKADLMAELVELREKTEALERVQASLIQECTLRAERIVQLDRECESLRQMSRRTGGG